MTRSCWPLALLTGLAFGALVMAGCSTAEDARRAAATAKPTPTSVAPIPKPANDAGPTKADDDYLGHLRDSGWQVTDPTQIIRVAHAECANLGHGNSTVDVIDQVVRQYRITGEAAVTQLVAAEATYCPRFLDH